MDIPDTKKFHSAVCQIETRASGMVWGPRSMGPALILGVYEKVPPARNVPYDPSILIPLGTNRYEPGHGPLVKNEFCDPIDSKWD